MAQTRKRVSRTRKTAAAAKAPAKKKTTTAKPAKSDAASKARAKLSQPKPRKPSRFEAWLNDPANAAAKVFVETWLEMAAAKETEYFAADVLRDLVADYELPYRDPTGFGRRMYEIYGDRYLAAKAANGR